ncbi:MAG: hypothetical protein ACLPX5_12005 [Dissulfurispiraceae bacterium]
MAPGLDAVFLVVTAIDVICAGGGTRMVEHRRPMKLGFYGLSSECAGVTDDDDEQRRLAVA